MKKTILYISIILFLIFIPLTNAIGQPPPPPPHEIPIDGGLLMLLAAGIGIAVKQMFFRKKKIK